MPVFTLDLLRSLALLVLIFGVMALVSGARFGMDASLFVLAVFIGMIVAQLLAWSLLVLFIGFLERLLAKPPWSNFLLRE